MVVVDREKLNVRRPNRAALSSRDLRRIPGDGAALYHCVLLMTSRVLRSKRYSRFANVDLVIAVTRARRGGANLQGTFFRIIGNYRGSFLVEIMISSTFNYGIRSVFRGGRVVEPLNVGLLRRFK